jgi:hypothetical protein
MKVTVKRRDLNAILEKIAEARSSHSVNINLLAVDPTPVEPIAASASQLAKPARYKDPAFTPVTPTDLGDELKAMAAEIDPNRVKRVYSIFKSMIGEEETAINEAKDLIGKLALSELESE